MKPKSIFTVGPFFAAQERSSQFGQNVYYNHCFSSTLETLIQLQAEYEDALAQLDLVAMEAKKKELDFYEAVIELAATALLEENDVSMSGSLHD